MFYRRIIVGLLDSWLIEKKKAGKILVHVEEENDFQRMN